MIDTPPTPDDLATAGPPSHYTESLSSMGNYLNNPDIPASLSLELKTQPVYAKHAAWNFNGVVWFDPTTRLFNEQVWRYHEPVAIAHAETLENLMNIVNNIFGWK